MHFTIGQRRARLGVRHCLAAPAASVVDAADAVVALHATDPATIFLAAAARVKGDAIAAMSQALYEEASLVRLLAMRRTLFVASRPVFAIAEASSSRGVAATERKRLEKFLAESNIDDPAAWLAAATEEVAAAMPVGGAPARELTKLVPRLATKIVMGAGTNHEVTAGATSRAIGLIAVEGRLVRGRPAGDWTGRQYRWHTREQWLGEAEPGNLDAAEASADLVRRWLYAFGPATYIDLKWWTGWTAKQTKAALAAVAAVEANLDDGTGFVLPDDIDAVPEPTPWAALLPSLDPTSMGWKQRGWYLGDHEAPLFDRFGNIGPTVWVDGRIVGGWGQSASGEVVTELLEDIGSDALGLVDAAAARCATVLGDTIVRPSFPTPLQKQIAAYP